MDCFNCGHETDIPTPEEAWQGIVDSFEGHVIDLNEQDWGDDMRPRRRVSIDGKDVRVWWPNMSARDWQGSYSGIPTHTELTAMIREAINFEITGKHPWDKDE